MSGYDWDKAKEERRKKEAMINAILLSFDVKLKYDYVFPSHYEICKLVKMYIKKRKVPKPFRKAIEELVHSNKDEYSEIEEYMSMGDHQFGKEWFSGYGTLGRWRDGEKEKAEERVEKYLTEFEKECMVDLQKAIRIKETPHAFDLMKAEIGSI